MDITAVALQGVQEALSRFDQAAVNLSRLSVDASSGDTVDLSHEVVALLAAQNQVEVDVATAKSVNEVEQRLLDLVG